MHWDRYLKHDCFTLFSLVFSFVRFFRSLQKIHRSKNHFFDKPWSSLELMSAVVGNELATNFRTSSKNQHKLLCQSNFGAQRASLHQRWYPHVTLKWWPMLTDWDWSPSWRPVRLRAKDTCGTAHPGQSEVSLVITDDWSSQSKRRRAH